MFYFLKFLLSEKPLHKEILVDEESLVESIDLLYTITMGNNPVQSLFDAISPCKLLFKFFFFF